MNLLFCGFDVAEFSSIPEPSPATIAHAAPKSASPWKKTTLAAVFSLFVSGTGQLYNHQPRKGLIFAGVSWLIDFLVWQTRVLLEFHTMIAVVLVALGWKIFVVVDAARCAGGTKKPELSVPFPKLTHTTLIAVMVLAALLPSWSTIKERSGFAAFKVPSASMCPTICIGDRLVADTQAYRSQSPLRGDIVMMKHHSSNALFLKRVIALPGDRVSPAPNGSVLVNGQPFRPPASCRMPIWEKREPADYSSFHSTTVPEGTFFVVGDNLEDSYDSRIPEFGAVTADMFRGRPLYLYWSPTFSRIGCHIQ